MKPQKTDKDYRGSDSRTMRDMCLNCKRSACNFGTCPDIERQEFLQRIAGKNARQYTMDGETHGISFWAQMYGLSPGALGERLRNNGGDLKKAVEPKPPAGKKYTCFGHTFTLCEWAILCNVSKAGLRYRLARGKPLEAVFFEAKERLKEGKGHV